MNWYKIARRNPYEQLANKFANQFFQWFTSIPSMTNYDGSKPENRQKTTIGYTDLPLTEQDFITLGMDEYYQKNLVISLLVYSTNEDSEPFVSSGMADSEELFYPEESESYIPTIITTKLRINKMNKSMWQAVKQELHSTLRHEFEHLNQFVVSSRADRSDLTSLSTPSSQKDYPSKYDPDKYYTDEHYMRFKDLTTIKLKLIHIKDQVSNETTKREVQQRMKQHCFNTPENRNQFNEELCEKAKSDLIYIDGIEKIVDNNVKQMGYFFDKPELEAFATSQYYTAKKKKIPVEEQIEATFYHALANPDYPHPEIDWLLYEAKQMLIHWLLRWIENRYPDYSKQRNQQPV